jgi:hypothetical protein
LIAGPLVIIAVVGAVDYLSGYEIFFFSFYVVAVALAAWFVGKRFGMIISVLSVAISLAGDVAAGAHYSSSFVPICNATVVTAGYFVVVWLVDQLRSLHHELDDRVQQRTPAPETITRQFSRLELPIKTQPATTVAGQQLLPISVSVITLNEEQNLARCLESVRGLATEIVVLDSGSVDRTATIARDFGAIVETHPWQGYIAQKNAALQRCSQPWVLCLDADEALSPELARSIRQLFATGQPNENGFWVNRRTYYLGDWIHHAWYPEWRLRLIRTGHAVWSGLDPHDKLEADGATGRLAGDLLHYPPFRDLRDHFHSMIEHSHTMADSYVREGRVFHWHQLLFLPRFAFFKRLVLKQGWRDGWRGWLISFANLLGTFAKYAFLFEAQRTKRNDSTAP